LLAIAENQIDSADRRRNAALDERVRTVSILRKMADQELFDVTT